MASKRLVLVVALLALATTPLLSASTSTGPEYSCTDAKNYTFHDESEEFDDHVKYTFSFSKSTSKVCIKMENIGGSDSLAGFGVRVDGKGIGPGTKNLDRGESRYFEKNISEYLLVRKDNHTVELGNTNDWYQFNFTRSINATDPDTVSPYIEDVEVLRYSENNSAALRVALRNPTKRGYGMYVQTKTLGTDREYTVGAPQPNETEVVVLPLEEGSSAVVAGKVRIFGEWGNPDHKYDQLEFMSKPDGETKFWHKEFENLPGTDSAAPYQNETAKHERAGIVDGDYYSERTQQIGAAAIVVLLVGAVVWRRRR